MLRSRFSLASGEVGVVEWVESDGEVGVVCEKRGEEPRNCTSAIDENLSGVRLEA